MRARIVALAGMLALAACSNDPTAVQMSCRKTLDKPVAAIIDGNDIRPQSSAAAVTADCSSTTTGMSMSDRTSRN